ncbi:MAG: C4-dicarboxylate TRAP transporter substrate-binding protein [Alphaproteobacteria bacterium]
MSRRLPVFTAVTALAAVLGAVAPAATQAADSIKITFISGYPPASPWVGAFNDQFIKDVDAALARTGKVRIDWNLAHSGQVVKARGELEGVQSGLGEMTVVPLGFHADKLPLYILPFVTPFTTQDPVVVAENFVAQQTKFDAFPKTWDSLGHFQLGVSTNIDNYVIVSKTPIKSVADLKGKKIGGAGPNLLWVTSVGATGVQSTLPDFYNAMSTGIVDGVIAWPHAMGAFKLCEPGPNMFDAGFGSAGMLALNINKDVWKNLPEEVRAAMTAAAPAWNQLQLKRLVDGATEMTAKCQSEFKTVVHTLPAADRAAWVKAMPPLALDWAKQNDAKGVPATAVLTSYMDFMRAKKQPVPRNWDKE